MSMLCHITALGPEITTDLPDDYEDAVEQLVEDFLLDPSWVHEALLDQDVSGDIAKALAERNKSASTRPWREEMHLRNEVCIMAINNILRDALKPAAVNDWYSDNQDC